MPIRLLALPILNCMGIEKEEGHQAKAISELKKTLHFWKEYILTEMEQNINLIWIDRVGSVVWIKTTELVAEDIEITK